MKVTTACASMLGLLFVMILGCESTDSPIGKETQQSPTDPLVPVDAQILGSWLIEEVIWFKEGVETQRIDRQQIDYGMFALTTTFMPDRLFYATYRHPIEKATDPSWLEWLGLEHLQDQDIIVTFRGKFQINYNQLWLDLTSASAKPKEAGEIDSDFEEPVFAYHLGDPGLLDISYGDDDGRLELIRQEGIYMVKFLHRRVEGE